jgi:hypothetical protein
LYFQGRQLIFWYCLRIIDLVNTVDPIPTEKLLLTYRVEPSCLGPDGISRIKDFCIYVKAAFVNHHSNYLIYQFIPGYGKNLAEMKLFINHKRLSEAKSSQYMSFFTKLSRALERICKINSLFLIDSFFGRQTLMTYIN